MDKQVSSLERVQIGMPVYDKYQENIGQVIRVRIKDRQIEDAASSRETFLANDSDSEWLSLIADIIEPDDSQAIDMAKELWNEGYIKLGKTKLQGFQRYVLPREIANVDKNGVYLNVSHWSS